MAFVHRVCISGLAPRASWGETSLFYNPDGALPSGVYFCTIKEQDGANDAASRLDRSGVFRVALGLPRHRDEERFGPRPPRPAKGGVVATGHDFTELDALMPHPVYAWMGWVQALSPSARTLEDLRPLLPEAYDAVVAKYPSLLTRGARRS